MYVKNVVDITTYYHERRIESNGSVKVARYYYNYVLSYGRLYSGLKVTLYI